MGHNTSNLPEVLSALQGHNPRRLTELNRLLNEVFPRIYEVSVRPIPNNQLEIIVWTTDPALQREDLSISLQQSGSGIGQVLAILYVVLTSNFPQTILIDEPQSFLHPGAARKLIEILRTFPQHQFVVATHSPTIIAAANPSTMTMLKLDEGQTTFQRIDPGSTKDLQVFLAEVGVRLSDVFGADNVLWVEGRTEELCFPKILNGIAHQSVMGTAIIGLTRTGDLEGRYAERALEIYNQLSRANSLAPPALQFILDSECRTEQEKRELGVRSNNRLRFLPRRMYENYLLHSAAIANVMNSLPAFREQPITADEIEVLIGVRLQDETYYCPQRLGGPQHRDRGWIDAARVLKEIFVRLSENRFEYEKVKHGVALTEWLIENAPQQLEELANLLRDVLAR